MRCVIIHLLPSGSTYPPHVSKFGFDKELVNYERVPNHSFKKAAEVRVVGMVDTHRSCPPIITAHNIRKGKKNSNNYGQISNEGHQAFAPCAKSASKLVNHRLIRL